MSHIIELPDLLTARQAGEVFHLCRQTIYKYIQDGTIPAFKNLTARCYKMGATNCECPTEGGMENVG